MPDAVKVETHSGEILASFSYADYLTHDLGEESDYRENRAIRYLVDKWTEVWRRDVYPDYYENTQLSEFLAKRLGIELQHEQLAVNHDHNCSEEPFYMAGPIRKRGEDKVSSGDRWVVLVWFDVGYHASTSTPDRVHVIESGSDDSNSYESCILSDFNGTGEVHCSKCERDWDYPGEYPRETKGVREYASLADTDGARCPYCFGPLSVGFSVGEAGYFDSEVIPHNPPAYRETKCEHCDRYVYEFDDDVWLDHDDGRACDAFPPFLFVMHEPRKVSPVPIPGQLKLEVG